MFEKYYALRFQTDLQTIMCHVLSSSLIAL